MNEQLNYTPWQHGENDSTPTGDINGNILGLELEIGDVYDYSGLNAAIDAGLLETEDSARGVIQLEYEDDHNNELELVFNADDRDTLISRLNQFNNYGGDYYTHSGSSAHVHLNRNFLNTLGLDELDILKAGEAIAPVIYAVSGRDYTEWIRWSEEHVNLNEIFSLRFDHIDDLQARHGSRYYLINLNNPKTIEVRGFSNNCNFNPDHINLFLAMAGELLINIAYDMKGLEYSAEGLDIVTRNMINFFNYYDYTWAVDRFDLYEFIDLDGQTRARTLHRIKRAKEQQARTKIHYLNEIEYYLQINNPRQAYFRVIDAIYGNNFNIANIDLNNLDGILLQLEEETQRQFLAALF